MLKGDFHVHSQFSPDSRASIQSILDKCLEVGINCIAITDHNTIEGALVMSKLAPFKVIIGEEIRTSQGEIIGLFLKKPITQGLSAIDTVKHIKAQGGLVSLPHPFDTFRGPILSTNVLSEILPQTDIIEAFNARAALQSFNDQALALANRESICTSSVSDAHYPIELGSSFTKIPDFDGTPEGFKRALLQGELIKRRHIRLVTALRILTKLRLLIGN